MKYLGHALILSAAILSIPAAAAGPRWTEASTGLAGHGPAVSAVTLNANASALFVRTSGGVAFRSTESGASWKPLGNIVGVVEFAADPIDASTIYAGTSSGVFVSTDGGDTWTAAGLTGKLVTLLAIAPTSPPVLYAGAGVQIYKSVDSGATWTTLSFAPSRGVVGLSSLAVDPVTPTTLYVSAPGIGLGPLYRSTDAGETWDAIDAGLFGRLMAIAPGTLYAQRAPGFSRSTDGGATWTSLGLDTNVGALAIDPANPLTLYAAVSGPALSGQALLKSIDGGQTWKTVNTTIPVAGIALLISPANSSTLYAGTLSGVLKSIDGGVTWMSRNTGLEIFNIGVLVQDPVDPALLYAGGDGGLFRSTNGGGNWAAVASFQATGVPPPGLPPPAAPSPTNSPAGVSSLLIDSTNPSILYAATYRLNGCFFTDNLLFKSTDGGLTWNDHISPKQSGCLTSGFLGMNPADPETLYLRYGDFYDFGYSVFKTTDGGENWSSKSPAFGSLYSLAIDPSMPSVLYLATETGVFVSTDSGDRWNPTGLTGTYVSVLAIDPIQTNVLYAVAAAGLFKSTDGAVTWSQTGDGLPKSVSSLILNPLDTNVLYAATHTGGVFRSGDGGATWTPFNDGLAQMDVWTLLIQSGAQTIVYAGTPSGIFKISDI